MNLLMRKFFFFSFLQKLFFIFLSSHRSCVTAYTSKKDSRWGWVLWRRGLSRATRAYQVIDRGNCIDGYLC